MPELSRFEGIVIKLLYNDNVQHNKPHIHAYYGGSSATIIISNGEINEENT